MKNKMELNLIFSLLSLVSLGFFQSVAPAPFAREHQVTTRHLEYRTRTKRCSCASFLDKECVYFCHLDIIWVNTPEHMVSYGLGSAPRQKRSLTEAADKQTAGSARCKCARRKDSVCTAFCHAKNGTRTRCWVTPPVGLSTVGLQAKGCQHNNPKDPPQPGIGAEKLQR